MIQPNELRIGNWITIANGDKWWPVTEIKENFIKVVNKKDAENWLNAYPEDYDGIPITKELLVEKLKAKDGGGVWYIDFGKFSIAFPSEGAYLCFESQPVSLHMPHIKYLHQLQNLVFSLTGKELEIKM